MTAVIIPEAHTAPSLQPKRAALETHLSSDAGEGTGEGAGEG